MNEFDIRPLHEHLIDLMEQGADKEKAEEVLVKWLGTFECKKNEDVERFLKNLSLRYEKENKSRTYLIVTEDLKIVAYFSISIKPIILDESRHKVSRTSMKKMKPLEIVKEEQKHQVISTFLIGQIGRDDRFDKDTIDSEGIFGIIFEKINEVMRVIGGHIVLIEVENEMKLIKLYQKYGFVLLGKGSEEDLTQLMKFNK